MASVVLMGVGLILILWSWGHPNIHGAYTGAFLIALSALHFLSESLETLS